MRNDIILIFGIAISLRATLSKLFNLALTGVYCTILIDFNGHLALMCEEDYRLHKVLYEGGHNNCGTHIFNLLYSNCHESCPCTPCYSPPEVTRSPHGLLHHTNGCTLPKTIFPITHCTDITQLIALVTYHTADCTDHTLYKPWTSSLSSPSIV